MPKKTKTVRPEQDNSARDMRSNALQEYSEGRSKATIVGKTKKEGLTSSLKPITTGFGDRSTFKWTWAPLSARKVAGSATDAGKVIDPDKTISKLPNADDYIATYKGYNGVLRPEYEMLEPFVLYDTEVYVKTAINRRLALMFREGFTIDGHLPQNVKYIEKRLQTLAFVMERPIGLFLRDILFNLLLGSNCFLRKIRNWDASPLNKTKGERIPVAGYTIIPAGSIVPYLIKGKITKWRRYFETGMPFEDIPIEDIVHLKWDVKPGHIYGTPRTVGVRDDIFALRRLEENIELLFINHLFPLFHVSIGTEDDPCTYAPDGTSEVDVVKYQIETMPKEGVFVTDHRVTVDAVGAGKESLETKELVQHLKSRVFTGLGVSAIDMGEGADATRATADNISQNLKDAIKADMDMFAELMKVHFFREWFVEAQETKAYSFSLQDAVAHTQLLFHEIDLDNRIKGENHIIQKYLNHLITVDEARTLLKLKPMQGAPEDTDAPVKQQRTHYWMHIRDLVYATADAKAEAEVRIAETTLPMEADHEEKLANTQIEVMKHQGNLEKTKATTHVQKTEASTKLMHAKTRHAIATGGPAGAAKKASPGAGTSGNKSRPANQHGRNPGPTRAKSARESFLNVLRDRLLEELKSGPHKPEEWVSSSSRIVDTVLEEVSQGETVIEGENSYTNQLREGIDRLKGVIGLTHDADMLAVLLDVGFESGEEEYGGQSESTTSLESHPPEDRENASVGNEGASRRSNRRSK